jgi:uncharacterized RDD family membrane protein YckC
MAEPACPLCGDTQTRRTKALYGRAVCRRCWAAFHRRRQIAWVIDALLIVPAAIGLAELGHFPAGPRHVLPTGTDWPWYAILSTLFALKDGFGGRSIGKAICDLQVVDRESDAPAWLHQSVLRSCFLSMPFCVLIEGMLMAGGPRIGDAIARTRVIWRRHRDNQIFKGVAGVAKVFE